MRLTVEFHNYATGIVAASTWYTEKKNARYKNSSSMFEPMLKIGILYMGVWKHNTIIIKYAFQGFQQQSAINNNWRKINAQSAPGKNGAVGWMDWMHFFGGACWNNSKTDPGSTD